MNRRKILLLVRQNVAAHPVKSWRLQVAEVYDKDGHLVEGYKRVIAVGRINDRDFHVETLATDQLLNSRQASLTPFLAGTLSDSALQFLGAQQDG